MGPRVNPHMVSLLYPIERNLRAVASALDKPLGCAAAAQACMTLSAMQTASLVLGSDAADDAMARALLWFWAGCAQAWHGSHPGRAAARIVQNCSDIKTDTSRSLFLVCVVDALKHTMMI